MAATPTALLWTMRNIYGVEPGEVFWAASDVGWVVGHSYIVYGPLLNGNTTIVYEGKPVGTPDPGAFWRVHRAAQGGGAVHRPDRVPRDQEGGPGRRAHPQATTSPRLRALFLAGERCDPDTLLWAEAQLGVPVIDHWWQTETGWAIAANPLGIEQLPVKPGSPTVPMPGYDVQRPRTRPATVLPAGQMGAIVHPAAAAARAACRRCGTPTSASGRPISPATPATT